MKTKRIGGFTLVELLVVVSIIVFIASISAPAITEFRRQHRLKASFQTIQGSFVRARAEAVAKRRSILVIVLFTLNNNGDLNGNGLPDFDIDGDTNPDVEGPFNTIHTVIESETTAGQYNYVGPVVFLSEFTQLEIPNRNFNYIFNTDGTLFFAGDKDNDPEASDDTDIVVAQNGNDKKCYVDIVRNTSRLVFSIR